MRGEYPGVETLDDYLEALASAAPTPGGGSAATIVGALGAALVAMVARITSQNHKYAEKRFEAIALIDECDDLRARFLRARLEDERAYGAVVLAHALPRANSTDRSARTMRLQSALAEAAHAPLVCARMASELLRAAARARALQNPDLMSDVVCAAHFASACLAASAANVRVNHRYLKDATLVAEQAKQLAHYEREAQRLLIDASGA